VQGSSGSQRRAASDFRSVKRVGRSAKMTRWPPRPLPSPRAARALHRHELDYQPAIVEHGGALVIVFERLDPATFAGDLYVTRSADGGATWSEPVQLTTGAALNDVQPHTLAYQGKRVLIWSRQKGSEADRDLWLDVLVSQRRRSVQSQ
jgi:hypothetical protein